MGAIFRRFVPRNAVLARYLKKGERVITFNGAYDANGDEVLVQENLPGKGSVEFVIPDADFEKLYMEGTILSKEEHESLLKTREAWLSHVSKAEDKETGKASGLKGLLGKKS